METVKQKRKKNDLKRKKKWYRLNKIKAYYLDKGYKKGLDQQSKRIKILGRQKTTEKSELTNNHEIELREMARKMERSITSMQSIIKENEIKKVEVQNMCNDLIDNMLELNRIEKGRMDSTNKIIWHGNQLAKNKDRIDLVEERLMYNIKRAIKNGLYQGKIK